MTSKERAVEIISRLPDDATAADIMAELYVQMKIEAGLRQLDEGRGITHDDARKRLRKWLGHTVSSTASRRTPLK
jgi:predicted transcriptional regulator